jgi:hypothetical protein
MTYDLRRLRLHGLIERIPKTQRYRMTPLGIRVVYFFTRTYARVLRPGVTALLDRPRGGDLALRRAFDQLEGQAQRWFENVQLAS